MGPTPGQRLPCRSRLKIARFGKLRTPNLYESSQNGRQAATQRLERADHSLDLGPLGHFVNTSFHLDAVTRIAGRVSLDCAS